MIVDTDLISQVMVRLWEIPAWAYCFLHLCVYTKYTNNYVTLPEAAISLEFQWVLKNYNAYKRMWATVGAGPGAAK